MSAIRASTSVSPAWGVGVVELCRDDQPVQQRSPLATAIGAGEEPGLAAQSQATQRPLGGVVGCLLKVNMDDLAGSYRRFG